MKPGPLSTLFHPFDTGELPLPATEDSVLFLGAEPGMRLPRGFGGEMEVVNGFRSSFLALGAAGLRVRAEPSGEDYAIALVLAGRHRGLNELNLAAAFRRVRAGGLIVVAGGKEDGIASLRKRIDVLAPVEASASKYHGVVFWMRRPADAGAVATMLEHANAPVLVEERFRTSPGMFSHARVDAGSRLLAQNLPADLSGRAADFCAGWGYLAAALLDRCPAITALDLFEADYASLEAAKANLADATRPAGFHWLDLASEPVERSYDVVVMNPPFHTGRAAEPSIGQAMIGTAAKALKSGGRLFLVANRGLPYEPALAAAFRDSGEMARDAAFKVLWARR